MTPAELLAEIRRAIEAVPSWKPQPNGDLAERDASAWEGDHDGWRFLVVSWPVVGAVGKDGRTWGYEGSAIRAPLVVRLTPELAKLAGERARGE